MPTRPPIHRPSHSAGPQSYERERRSLKPTRRLYSTARWRARRRAQLAAEPLCRKCSERGLIVPADTADHIEAHRGDIEAFWQNELQSLCAPCHSRLKQREETLPRVGG